MDVEGREKPAAGEKEARKRTWRRGPQDRTLQSKAWTLKALGGKTVWDWLQLLGVLAIPVVIAVGGWMFGAQQSAHQNKLEDQRAKNERQIEEQRAQDTALQAYLDQMSQLMLGGNLRNSEEDSEVRTLARARTRTVLARLDDQRKGTVVQFLYEASLIVREHPVVSLSDVRLRGADLSHLDLSGAYLSGADLSNADLSSADLSDADLSAAHLIAADLRFASISGANMSGTYLSRANLSETDCIDADLSGADLSGAKLSGAFLRDADLRETYLIETDLSDTDLSGANLRDARGVTDKQLLQAKTLEDTIMPDGSIHQ
jgi:uncharacterized protein YjbI with pentapeptide repeats